MIRKIYLDMDGVLSDFSKRFIEVNTIDPEEVRGTFTESEAWDKFVNDGHFATLEWFPGGIQLWDYLKPNLLVRDIEILSSSGGHRFYETIAKDKTEWLRKNNIHIPVNVVPGKRFKRDFAHPSHLLIDDTERNVVEFIEAGGEAILHRTFEETLVELKRFL